MRRLNILMFLSLIAGAVQAQFINNGATVTIQPGATLRVETDFINNSGTVTNSGTLEVQGNFDNNATFTSTDPSTVRFIGTADANVSTGGAVLRNVEMSKNGGDILLVDNSMSIAGTLNFNGDDTRIVTGAQSLVLPTSADITGVDANEYVATTGVGRLIKTVAGNATVNLEVGDLTNYTPVSSVVTGTTYTAATLGGRAIIAPSLTAKYADASDYINREWQVAATGIAGYANTMTGTYVAGDVVGMSSLVKGATFHTGDWRFDGSSSGASTVIASTTNTDVRLSGLNFFGKVNLKAYLAGALPSGTTMTTTLNSILPTSSPYSLAPFNAPAVTAPSIPATATDWILIEVRDATTPATVISQTSGFILSSGSIVSYDGSPLRLKNAVASGHIALRHRNHLGIRTATALDLVNPPVLKDFSLGTGEAYTNGALSNANMRLVGSVYTLWSGNANSNTNVRYLGPSNDNSAILTALSGVTGAVITGPSAYVPSDLNMNAVVRYLGPSNDNSALLNALGGVTGAVLNQHL
jgi:hypothetical protein